LAPVKGAGSCACRQGLSPDYGRDLATAYPKAVVEQIDGNAGRLDGVAAEPGDDPDFQGATYDHAPRVLPAHALAGKLLAAAAAKGTEEGRGLLRAEAGRFQSSM
jgi:hypothetical protein